MTEPYRLPRTALCAALLLALLKLALVAEEEIVAHVYDSTAYASMAVDSVWFGSYHDMNFRPGLGVVAAALRLLGVPYRLGLELLWIGATLLLGTELLRASRSVLLAGAVQGLLLFHPWVLDSFRLFYSEPLWAVASVTYLALALRLWRSERWSPLGAVPWLMALVLGVWDSVRTETMLLVPTVLVWSVLLYAGRNGWRWRFRELVAVLVPLVGIAAEQGTLRLANGWRSGVPAMSAREAPGFQALMRALYRVDAPDAFRYAPVTRASLQAAIAQSPTLQKFEDRLLDPATPATRHGAAQCGKKGEFGSWLNFLLLQNTGATVGEADAVMAQAAREIEAALAAGRLPRRQAYWPIDPSYRLWLPDLPARVVEQLGYLVELPEWKPMNDRNGLSFDRATGTPADRRLFDRAATRRASRRRLPSRDMGGYAFSSRGALEAVTVEDSSGRILAVDDPDLGKPFEVAGEVKLEDGVPHALPAAFTVAVPLRGPEPARLGLWRGGQRIAAVGLAAAAHERVAVKASDGSVVWARVRYDWAIRTRHWQERAVQLIRAAWPWAWLLAGALVLFAFGRRQAVEGWAPLLVGLVAVTLAARVVFYAILVAMMGWVYPRYVQVASPLLVPASLALAAWLGAAVGRRRQRT